MSTTSRLLVFLALLCAPLVSNGEDWPKFRGPSGDGTWPIASLPERFPSGGPEKIWSLPMGQGYAGISVVSGRLYTMDRPKPTDKGATPDGEERVLCCDAQTGKILWEHRYPAHYGDLDYGNGPRCTPTVHNGRVYTLGAVGQVCCLDAVTGRVHWQRQMVQEMDSKIPTWGFAASPVLHNDVVIVHTAAQPDGCFVALETETGKERWRASADPAGYCTPILAQTDQGSRLFAWTPENVVSIDPNSGQLFWTVPYKVTYGVSIASPIYHEQIVFVSGYWEGSKAIRPQHGDPTLLWEENRELRGLMASPLYRDGFVYLLDKRFGVTCFDLKTGTKRWDDGNTLTPRGRNPQLTMVWVGDTQRVVVFNAEGELVLARLTPEGFVENDRARILESKTKTWANPAFANGCIFCHNGEQLVCVRLAEPVSGQERD